MRALLAERERLVEEQASAIRDLRARFDDSEAERKTCFPRARKASDRQRSGGMTACLGCLPCLLGRSGEDVTGQTPV